MRVARLAVLVMLIPACDPGPRGTEVAPSTYLADLPVQRNAVNDTASAYVIDWRFSPNYSTVPLGRTVEWEFVGPKGHTVHDVSGMELYESGDGRPGDRFAYRFVVAGRYDYHCDPHPLTMRGVIDVPFEVSPSAGPPGTTFNLVWAAEVPPAGFGADVQIKEPGSATFVNWLGKQTTTGTAWTPTEPGTYQFRARLRKISDNTSSNWSQSATIEVTDAADLPPIAIFGFECHGLDCTFRDASDGVDGTVVGWAWDLGNGETPDVPEPATRYAARQPWTVSLAVTDDAQVTSAPSTRNVNAFNNVPNPVFTFSCNGLTCSFTDGSFDSDGTVVAWNWTFGDGSTDATQNPTHSYSAGGTYTIELVVTDAVGRISPTDTVRVTVSQGNTGPAADFTYDCTGLVCTFTDLSIDTDGVVAEWAWDFADGNTSTEQNPVHTYAANGDYVVALTVVDDGGLSSDTFTKELRPRSISPVAAFTSSCTFLSCVFTDASTDADGPIAVWNWDLGDGTLSGEQNPSHAYAVSGTYTVTLEVVDAYGSADTTVGTVTVAGNAPPVAVFTAACTKLDCTFTDGSSDSDGAIVTWAWDFGDGTVSTDPSPTHTYAADGTYTVVLTVTDDAAATGTASQDVPIAENFLPIAAFTASCLNLDCTFTDASSDQDGTVVVWDWDFGDGGTDGAPSPSHTYAAAGSYTVTLTVTDNEGGASVPALVTVAVVENTLPVAAFTVSCVYLDCTFADASTDADGMVSAWSWDFGDGTSSSEASPSHTFAAEGSYTVTLTVTDDQGAASAPAVQGVTVALNQAPVAAWTWSCDASRLCTMDASTSTDDVGVVLYEWLAGNPPRLLGTGVVYTRQFGRSGPGQFTLTVTDELGLTSSLTQTITVP